ncbi:3-oxo-5-alpha-steroid 4-dehydrogenase 2a isoform X2 [Genypterus blacodes]|uniref:3-oxo-5-alpha-steroid 4-dehydrogenase 2a isoform X2 n=1 Tax=Genypterus blacodes TaxID=154954 RepID=UPI003F777314
MSSGCTYISNSTVLSGELMECKENLVLFLSWGLLLGGVAYLLRQMRHHTPYGRYAEAGPSCPSRPAWFLQELPSFLVPLLLDRLHQQRHHLGRTLLLCTFTLHYFQRTFIYAFLTRGRPVPVSVVLSAAIFCSMNGFLQGHFLLHCVQFEDSWLADVRLTAGFVLFAVGLLINVHSDHVLRRLRTPGHTGYKIPHGGMFEFVSGANFLGEILEWSGYAVATWSFPSFAFAFFTICSIGPRALHHHADYRRRFEDYPRSRKALIPFIL